MKQLTQTLAWLAITLATVQLSAQTPTWFTNVTNVVGMNVPSNFRACAADINNDNYPDIIAVSVAKGDIYNTRAPLVIFLNVEDTAAANPTHRRFIDITAQSKINVATPDTGQNANLFTVADLNNDGNLDIITGIYYHRIENYPLPNDRGQVYLGDGMGKFTVLPNSGITSLGFPNERMYSAMDYDRDGNLDLFVAAWFADYTNNIFDHAYLLKGRGDGTFINATDTGIGNRYEPMYGSAATDWNNDCYPDILTGPYCRTGGTVFKNNGNGTFSNVSASVGYDLYKTGDGQASCTFSVVPEDVDNDGDMDFFLCVVHGGNDPGEFRSTIAINNGPDSNYSFNIKVDRLPVGAPASSHRGDYNAAFLDFDNDGLKDVVMVQGTYKPLTDRTYFWKQLPDHTFKDVSGALGLLKPELKSTGGVEPFDIDLDGDDDILITTTANVTTVWNNNVGSTKKWVSVKLKGRGGDLNKSCIGARVYVYCNGRLNMREVMAGRGQHVGQQPFILNFGLDSNATGIDSIVVRWPTSTCRKTRILNPPMNAMLTMDDFNDGISEETQQLPQVKVFPNPTSKYVIVQSENLLYNLKKVTISDMTGKEVAIPYQKSDTDKLIFDMGLLDHAMYLVTVQLKDGRVVVTRIIKE